MALVTLINTMAVKPDRMEEFIATQEAFATATCERHQGPRGGRMYRNRDGSTVVLISQFESIEDQMATLRSPEFQAHLAKLREMVDSSSPAPYEEAYTYGTFK